MLTKAILVLLCSVLVSSETLFNLNLISFLYNSLNFNQKLPKGTFFKVPSVTFRLKLTLEYFQILY